MRGAVRLDGFSVNGEHARVGKQADEIRHWPAQPDFQMLRPQGLYAQHLRLGITCHDIRCIIDLGDGLHVDGSRVGVDQSAVAIDEIRGSNGIAV